MQEFVNSIHAAFDVQKCKLQNKKHNQDAILASMNLRTQEGMITDLKKISAARERTLANLTDALDRHQELVRCRDQTIADLQADIRSRDDVITALNVREVESEEAWGKVAVEAVLRAQAKSAAKALLRSDCRYS